MIKLKEGNNIKSKNIIRENLRMLREAADSEFIKIASINIADKISGLPEFKESKIIMLYMNFRNEVDTSFLISYCKSAGKRIALPSIDTDVTGLKGIRAYEVSDIKNDTKPGFYGIIEPIQKEKNLIMPNDIDMVVVPGIAFDEKKHRVGYGAGYYDRFLKKLRKDCNIIGVGFDFQVIDYIPNEDHDIPLGMIVTEKRII